MEKRKTTIIFVIGVMLIVSTFLICHKHTAYQTTQLDEVKLKDIKDNNMFAIMVKENGEYAPSDSFPEKGYKLNKDKSGCMDNNNELIPNSLSYDEDSQQVIVSTGQTSYCYLYFDKQLSVDDIRKEGSGLSTNPVGGMYRYQGADVNNYICLGSLNNTNCKEKTDEMYRIIGITPEGNIKVMKQTKYTNNGTNTFVWNTKYDEKTSTEKYKCDDGGCPEWPDSEIYKTLNADSDSFLSNLSSDIKNKIEDWDWWYGDINYDYANKTADEIYQIETGQVDSQYYPKLKQGAIETGKWAKMNSKAKIGLIYLHDYYYQSTSNICHYDNNTHTQCKDNGWMHISKNDNSFTDNEQAEWTMSRIGRAESSSIYFYAWRVTSSGSVGKDSLKNEYSVRPVFYLTSDIELGGAGSTTEPFYIAS